ncbi:asparagine synthase (glutamine-hydrolyzing) [Candidatus Cryosericum odellii]|jgi:asparagine synthase (glutamine-hydrolysing)|uniref:asparagine synthase (glutamine-hydrolyzing) n=1 Tax=Candidatus Cryosericum odellii TaxID=2290917 RepID=A0A398CWY0_9BACT|nr:asparagine synthase (glutamine-hydrolyzing) [Candidatus Cryosericum odellii]RIE07053.1 asparagine synthase (glutamine-hydrolyzing) [Candidatus Cryosericum odellii]RIE08036.1 asparagine synthase (glutamine-hydrolyzing) [Candidatus Cryosericum odellii]
MCGIAGFVARQPLGEARARSLAHAMAERLVHRGPDAEGVWSDPDGYVALGHRRLSIIDLSAAGSQPMTSASGRWTIVFNGEIFNYQDLRVALERASRGTTKWRGHSDTEVILAAVEQWGVIGTLRELVGQFAIGLWDNTEKQLYLARDRFGEKPLYYGFIGSSFAFASELKAFSVLPDWNPRIDEVSSALYLQYSYVPSPRSIYQGIWKVPPASMLCLKPAMMERQELPAREPYWEARQFVATTDDEARVTYEHEVVQRVETLLKEAVACRMMSDVPLGAFLSGGIDSTTVAALMQEQSTLPIRTFTLGFPVEGYDEAPYARRVAEHLGTSHTEVYVTPQDAYEIIPALPDIYDEPFADSSQIPTFLVSRIARADVTVALSGDGGDEIMGGYNRYAYLPGLWRRFGSWPPAFRGALSTLAMGIPVNVWNALGSASQALRSTARRQRLVGDKMQKLAGLAGARSLEDAYRLLTTNQHWRSLAVAGTMLSSDLPPASETWSVLRRMMYWDTQTYLPDDILCKVDRASMACSLEARAPFLDHRLYEYMASLSDNYLIRDGQTKWLLRQVLKTRVPEALTTRPKSGFGIPIGEWLRGPLRDWAEDLLDAKTLGETGLFDVQSVQHLWKEHVSRRHNWQYDLWTVLMFEAWRRKWTE